MKSFQEFLINEELIQENARSFSNFLSHLKDDKFVIVMSVEKGINFWADMKHVDSDEAQRIMKSNNLKFTSSFRDELKVNRIGYTSIRGHYDETVVDTKTSVQATVPVDERSTICYGNQNNRDKLMEICVKWAKKTHQDSILIANDGKAWLGYTCNSARTIKINGRDVTQKIKAGIVEYIGEFHPGQGDGCFTMLKSVSDTNMINHNSKPRAFRFDVGKASTALQKYFTGTPVKDLKEDLY